ncbi:uncharacterized protein PGTG_07659 [Puccinia graminis f. sp. tritici CRL 75-36-700-3]|uniref:Uncharacterized protein n=1 Tax=Puccinia graminis f. sp. tritici (strain CRL 75-36-700-3 / race SCCL) TaxID=418459 RepID=E3KCY4_PUCGT|nr:uncharacterized protein PGTG_07659 [Puccinia graminis f. sp. tritici CRL 75-36-700-3]EFP82262.1 hypothetical protein PGTG_07659 [Puccinia graminis f. sp. tritici CRL 75-36-700-3]
MNTGLFELCLLYKNQSTQVSYELQDQAWIHFSVMRRSIALETLLMGEVRRQSRPTDGLPSTPPSFTPDCEFWVRSRIITGLATKFIRSGVQSAVLKSGVYGVEEDAGFPLMPMGN